MKQVIFAGNWCLLHRAVGGAILDCLERPCGVGLMLFTLIKDQASSLHIFVPPRWEEPLDGFSTPNFSTHKSGPILPNLLLLWKDSWIQFISPIWFGLFPAEALFLDPCLQTPGDWGVRNYLLCEDRDWVWSYARQVSTLTFVLSLQPLILQLLSLINAVTGKIAQRAEASTLYTGGSNLIPTPHRPLNPAITPDSKHLNKLGFVNIFPY